MGIYLNQLGYTGKGEKRAVIPFPCDAFRIVDEEGHLCKEGKTFFFGYDKASGDQVTVADFSDFEKQGLYRLEATQPDGKIMQSCRFAIRKGVYDPLLKDLMKAFYYLRCGCALEPKYAGKFAHAACHTGKVRIWEEVFPREDAGENRAVQSAGLAMERNVVYREEYACGGWHDAGDYGRYVTAGACALAHLLYAYRMYPETFTERTWNIPESGNGIPDLLNECRYELEWFLKMQREDGGVHHKLTTAGHAAFVMPEEDLGQLYFLPVSSMATADHAAVCALAAGIYRKYDAAFAYTLEQAARRSYAWLKAHPEFLGFRNPPGCWTGEYGEWNDDSNRFWAASELYALTGEATYLADLKASLQKRFPRLALGYGEVGGFGVLAYLLSAQEKEETLREEFLKAIVQEAAQRVRVSEECGYATAQMDWEYGWGSNMGVMQRGMLFAIADYFGLEKSVQDAAKSAELPKRRLWPGETEEPYVQGSREERGWSMRDHAAAQLDYLLGCNAMGISYVTGNGEQAYNYPHLRPSHADGIEECIPGMVSGGPNRRPADEVGRVLIPEGTPSMKCYLDRYECYSLNEITIYWNSPAVFVVAYLLAKESEV